MRRYHPAYDPTPHEHAYFDGKHYHCYNNRCIIDGEHPYEYGRLPHPDGTYTPILRCKSCGKLYWGIQTWEEETKTQPQQAPSFGMREWLIHEQELSYQMEQPQEQPQEQQPKQQEEDIILPNLLTV